MTLVPPAWISSGIDMVRSRVGKVLEPCHWWQSCQLQNDWILIRSTLESSIESEKRWLAGNRNRTERHRGLWQQGSLPNVVENRHVWQIILVRQPRRRACHRACHVRLSRESLVRGRIVGKWRIAPTNEMCGDSSSEDSGFLKRSEYGTRRWEADRLGRLDVTGVTDWTFLLSFLSLLFEGFTELSGP